MGEEEAASGGGAVDGAAAEEGFGVEADEDLPHHEVLREAVEGAATACPPRHRFPNGLTLDRDNVFTGGGRRASGEERRDQYPPPYTLRGNWEALLCPGHRNALVAERDWRIELGFVRVERNDNPPALFRCARSVRWYVCGEMKIYASWVRV